MTNEALQGLLLRGFAGAFLAWIFLFVVLALHTVRRLRRQPGVEDRLGVEFIRGWRVLNVAMAVSWPRRVLDYLDYRAQPIVHFHAATIRAHTTRADRVLGRACYAAHVLTVLLFLAWRGVSALG
ncbi:MAG: hypothetical protein KGS28_05245 [Betaproteobacteria bacterium]|nr:hypothetical protein [Betaproteobacteria bacterium]